MTKDELQKLTDNLNKELIEIDKELSDIASENPLVRGDFEVKVQDMGPTQEDAAQEAGELDRNQALVDSLERRRKEIVDTLEKIKAGSYGKCETCSADIGLARLKAISVASLCISCAQKSKI
ncbi:MAG: hypothetical protein A3C61_00180 [Candidatus Yanofskybacteria bacterium RIFCSPHIGHO2_02_FULL_39_10]|uniref:Zinc finger DksA/TraR C4-type domain-containing protein n=1 Tax=Candidatus Yanofskybacteria bacterium RIFCSPHIGHO2_02_FULL_39_10 TaxID=1802674 RepID=A0A1F8FAA7_9BACT|nr:MAG: hypothetical protein A3C61_00180 [Candidatus Yanofskybacteria bacterium RIFCSPHIGHO2_02_FULL_39_10]